MLGTPRENGDLGAEPHGQQQGKGHGADLVGRIAAHPDQPAGAQRQGHFVPGDAATAWEKRCQPRAPGGHGSRRGPVTTPVRS
jgi:hypothetical protein